MQTKTNPSFRPITRRDIEAFRDEAGAAGDISAHRAAVNALGGDDAAVANVADWINHAQDYEECPVYVLAVVP